MGFIVKNDRLERTEFSFFTPTQIKFGIGKVGMLANEIQIEADLAEHTSVLIVADKGVVAAGLVDKVKAALADSPYEVKDVFDDVPPDSDVDTVKKVADEIADHDIDLIIAVGGGSVMDTAKLSGIIGTYGGHIRDYEGGFMVPGPCIPLIAIPTTVGTGSEVSVVAVVKDHEHTTKISIFSPHLYPRMAVLDPEMVATLPPKLVAYTGMDALTHAIEAFTSSENQPLSDAIALHAAEMIADNLEAAVKDSSNTDARAKLQIAAMMAGIAFTNAPVGATHAIAHTLGSMYNLHHGLSNAIALPYVMEFNLEHCASRYASIARAFGVSEVGISDIELGKKAIEAVKTLKKAVGIPERFRDLNVPTDDETIDKITEVALSDLWMAFNVRKAEHEEFKPLIRQVV